MPPDPGPYRQYLEPLGVAIERNTPRVPPDGFYYVLREGATLGRFRTLKQAQLLYRRVIAEVGWRPDPMQQESGAGASRESIERYLDEKDRYWAESHRFTSKTGRGMGRR